MEKARKVQKQYVLLSLDEVTIIVLYTYEEGHRESSLYFLLNTALRSADRLTAVLVWRDFIWLLLHALGKLPGCPAAVVYRGCTMSPEQLGLDLTPGAEFQWSGFSSTASTAAVMNTFLGFDGPRTMWQLQLTYPWVARNISSFSLRKQATSMLESTPHTRDPQL